MLHIGNLQLGLDNLLPIILVMCFALICSVHAMIYKREAYAAFAWLGVILLSPIIFSVMFLIWDWQGVLIISPIIASLSYVFLGINRLTRKFRQGAFRRREFKFNHHLSEVIESLLHSNRKWRAIAATGNSLNYSPMHFCKLDILCSGDNAYASMLAAIENSESSISFYSYIFNYDQIGRRFVHALADAANRGVKVNVLVDAVGSHESIGELERYFTDKHIGFAGFMPVLLKSQFSNLRNHRKLLIIDAKQAFTGGLNISDDYWSESDTEEVLTDLHFNVSGRLVNYLQEVFVNDWAFATKQQLRGAPWFNEELPEKGKALGRLIIDGPGRDEERLSWHFLNAINIAQTQIKILTPYFLPNSAINSALCSAALRGVKVEIIVPLESDHHFMDWALRGSLFELLQRGCAIYLLRGSFDHSKFLVVDDDYASIGSANWDARSLRLNYELNIEVYSHAFAEQLITIFNSKKTTSDIYTQQNWENRTLFEKLRDGFSRLFSPYL